MPNNPSISIDEIIAGIDNDFNLDNSDWVARIAAWTIEVLSQLKCTVTERKRIKVNVSDRITMTECSLNFKNMKIYDSNGCEVKEYEGIESCCGHPSTGKGSQTKEGSITKTLGATEINNENDSIVLGVPTGFSEYEYEGNKVTYENHIIGHGISGFGWGGCERFYNKINDRQLQLNFDANYIYIEYDAPKTTHSDIYGCELPVIPDNGILKEAIKYYCMYKILCRGVKHPVFNLAASQYGTNPYFMWMQLKEKAKRSVIIDSQGGDVDDKGEWKKALIDFTFD